MKREKRKVFDYDSDSASTQIMETTIGRSQLRIRQSMVVTSLLILVGVALLEMLLGCSDHRSARFLSSANPMDVRCDGFWDSIAIEAARVSTPPNPIACYKRALLLSEAAYRTNGDYREGFREVMLAKRAFEVLAENGNVNAELNLAMMQENGDADSQSYPVAMRWYMQAAEQGKSAHACYHIGLLTYLGLASEGGELEARRWYEKGAVNGGDPYAQSALGGFYLLGLGGLPKDTTRALELIEASAKEGNMQAQWQLKELKRNIDS
jgi:hypothetical protein